VTTTHALAAVAIAASAILLQSPPNFEPVQPELFSAGGAMTQAWADVDGDGDLDLFVGFARDVPNRLYRNDGGRFTDVAAALGIADLDETRAAAWGDFDADGAPDLYVGFIDGATKPNRLYHNEGGKRFVDVAAQYAVNLRGVTRQPGWIDFDGDGDVDLFVSFRDKPNMLFRNDGKTFVNVAAELGVADPRKTVGASWFDFDEDGDLDVYVANQEGDGNALFRNDGARFVDVAKDLGIDAMGRPVANGSVGTCITDFDSDGRLDLFVANYGPSFLYRVIKGRFTDVAPAAGLAIDHHNVSCAWGDYDNDGHPDLYVSGYVNGTLRYRDYFFHSDGTRFSDVIPQVMLDHDADHGVQWADFDADGDLDVALADGDLRGSHYLFRNLLSKTDAARSLQVLVVDKAGHYTKPGAEVRLYAAGTRRVLGSGLVDTGSGYNAQGIVPLHFGLANLEAVDVEVTTLTGSRRVVTRLASVDPRTRSGKAVVIRAP
jgi:penicillin G amidase